MEDKKFTIVTGAFGYTGRFITKLLLEKGTKVKTLTNHPKRKDPFGGRVEAMAYNFDNPHLMVESLRGADTVYNTYWVRFDRGGITQGQAVANIQNLVHAAKEAGVKRFVHISIANPSEESQLPYYNGKGVMERTLIESGLSYAILRPTVLFGDSDILINNIAWLLRRSPIFGVFGSGTYRIQPVHVEDVAKLAVEAGQRDDNLIWDAVGPEVYSYEGLVRIIKRKTKSRAMITHISPRAALIFARLTNPLFRDVLITKEEISGLMQGLLVSKSAPRCTTHFSKWLDENKANIGKKYASELERHYS